MNILNFPLWHAVWVTSLVVGWLIPNHYPPWTSFHLDAWIACAMIPVSAIVIVRASPCTAWHGMALVVAILLALPGMQFAFGLVRSAGNFWISTAYLLGFLLAILTGGRWEHSEDRSLLDCLFLAIGTAAILSVGLQLHQWLSIDGLELWSMGGGSTRPYANFGQPNQLGTFLIWAILALAWALLRKRIGGCTAVGAAMFLLFGVALTASRTAWMAIAMLVVAAWLWRDLWSDARVPWIATGLGLYFVICHFSIGGLGEVILGGLPGDGSDIARITGESRPVIWAVAMDAAMQRPWFGFGWNQVALAQMAAALNHRPLHVFFSTAHNLFLDFVLWCGIPIGIMVSAWLVWWFWSRIRMVRHAEHAILLLFLLVVANHALLELPLHHAYFLLPVGLVIGALDVKLGVRPIFFAGRFAIAAGLLVATVLLALVIHDYARVESTYQTLRFEWANIKTQPAQPPDVILLTQWRDFVRMVRFEPTDSMLEQDLQWLRDVTPLYPNAGFFLKIATAMALNKRPQEAALWLRRMCPIVSAVQCEAVKETWAQRALGSPQIAAVAWPL